MERNRTAYHRPKKYVRGVLSFNAVCIGCGYKINKCTEIVPICHECEGGHDVHTHPQARSLLRRERHIEWF